VLAVAELGVPAVAVPGVVGLAEPAGVRAAAAGLLDPLPPLALGAGAEKLRAS
jgi:hypothetical protein